MMRYEYKVCPAPSKGRKGSGVKGPQARFARGLELMMNELGAEGWEYQRSDILPSEERQGLTSSQTVYRSVLVFRRALPEAGAETRTAPPVAAPVPVTTVIPEVLDETATVEDLPEDDTHTPDDGQDRVLVAEDTDGPIRPA